MAEKLTAKQLMDKAKEYFKANPDEKTVVISEDGQCFPKKAESAAKSHAANNKISYNTYNK